MRALASLAIFTVATTACWGPLKVSAGEPTLVARVDPRVELLSLIFRLAGSAEYDLPSSKSPYADAAARHFAAHADHRVIQLARRLRAQHGVSYDAVMSLAVHLEDAEHLRERTPFSPRPPRLDERWPPDQTQKFLSAARDFVHVADFAGFVRSQQPYYDAVAARLSAMLKQRGYLAWFDQYFGAKAQTEFYVIVGLLNGGSNYGVGVVYPDGREEITPVIGAWKWDGGGLPVFDEGFASTVVHEFCHSYTNRLVDAFAGELRPVGEKLFGVVEERMRAQAYGTWQTMMYETFVRMCVVRFFAVSDGAAAGAKQAAYEAGRAFLWAPDLADLLAREYEPNRARFPTMRDFVPRIVAYLNENADRYLQHSGDDEDNRPRIISMIPANGATNVDPAADAIVISFDRPMRDGQWSICGGGGDFPEIVGRPRYDAARKTLTIRVKLKPAWTYRFSINCPAAQSTVSAAGVALKPVDVTFTTRAAPK